MPLPPTASPGSRDPNEGYRERARWWQSVAAAAARHENAIGWIRAAAFVLAIVAAALALDGTASPWWPAGAVLTFVALGYRHEAARRRRRDADRRGAFARRGLARLDGTWREAGPTGSEWAEPDHLYAGDLDILGPGSLFQLVTTATTAMGHSALARSLLHPAPVESIRARQAAVLELAGAYDFRESLASAGGEVAWRVHHERLAHWASDAPRSTTTGWRVGLLALVVANGAALIAYTVSAASGALPLASVLALATMALVLRPRVRRAVAGVERAARDLEALSRILAVMEGHPFNSPLLEELRRALESHHRPPANALRSLGRLADLVQSTENQLLIPVRLVTLWLTQAGLAIDDWRRRHGRAVATWLTVVGEMEALCSLASHAYDHPGDTVPDIDPAGGTRFEASGLAHPLLPPERAVANDVELGRPTRVLIVSGSNMSGKSTLLRAIGVNAALALAGGTVRASALCLSPVRLASSIQVSDSLADGRSRFYAEIVRLQAIMTLAGRTPVLFLIDEILHGTNSHDRRIGTEAVVRGLVERDAIGVLTTHDLALTPIADLLGPGGRNAHFGDTVVAGRLVFDYRLTPGVVGRSNALRLMRDVGLPVGEDD